MADEKIITGEVAQEKYRHLYISDLNIHLDIPTSWTEKQTSDYIRKRLRGGRDPSFSEKFMERVVYTGVREAAEGTKAIRGTIEDKLHFFEPAKFLLTKVVGVPEDLVDSYLDFNKDLLNKSMDFVHDLTPPEKTGREWEGNNMLTEFAWGLGGFLIPLATTWQYSGGAKAFQTSEKILASLSKRVASVTKNKRVAELIEAKLLWRNVAALKIAEKEGTRRAALRQGFRQLTKGEKALYGAGLMASEVAGGVGGGYAYGYMTESEDPVADAIGFAILHVGFSRVGGFAGWMKNKTPDWPSRLKIKLNKAKDLSDQAEKATASGDKKKGIELENLARKILADIYHEDPKRFHELEGDMVKDMMRKYHVNEKELSETLKALKESDEGFFGVRGKDLETFDVRIPEGDKMEHFARETVAERARRPKTERVKEPTEIDLPGFKLDAKEKTPAARFEMLEERVKSVSKILDMVASKMKKKKVSEKQEVFEGVKGELSDVVKALEKVSSEGKERVMRGRAREHLDTLREKYAKVEEVLKEAPKKEKVEGGPVRRLKDLQTRIQETTKENVENIDESYVELAKGVETEVEAFKESLGKKEVPVEDAKKALFHVFDAWKGLSKRAEKEGVSALNKRLGDNIVARTLANVAKKPPKVEPKVEPKEATVPEKDTPQKKLVDEVKEKTNTEKILEGQKEIKKKLKEQGERRSITSLAKVVHEAIADTTATPIDYASAAKKLGKVAEGKKGDAVGKKVLETAYALKIPLSKWGESKAIKDIVGERAVQALNKTKKKPKKVAPKKKVEAKKKAKKEPKKEAKKETKKEAKKKPEKKPEKAKKESSKKDLDAELDQRLENIDNIQKGVFDKESAPKSKPKKPTTADTGVWDVGNHIISIVHVTDTGKVKLDIKERVKGEAVPKTQKTNQYSTVAQAMEAATSYLSGVREKGKWEKTQEIGKIDVLADAIIASGKEGDKVFPDDAVPMEVWDWIDTKFNEKISPQKYQDIFMEMTYGKMKKILHEMKKEGIDVYIDDMSVKASSWENLPKHIRQAIENRLAGKVNNVIRATMNILRPLLASEGKGIGSKGVTIGSAITRSLINTGKVEARGVKVGKNYSGVFKALRVYADPLVEHSWWVFMKEGRIIHHEQIGIGLPGMSQFWPGRVGGRGYRKYMMFLEGEAKRVGADSIVPVHNHTLSPLRPSGPDITFMYRLMKDLESNHPHLKERIRTAIIIDSNKYATIDLSNVRLDTKLKAIVKYHKLKNLPQHHAFERPEVDHELLGQNLSDAGTSLMKLMKETGEESEGYTYLIYTKLHPESKTDVITGVRRYDNSKLRSQESLLGSIIRDMRKEVPGSEVAVLTHDGLIIKNSYELAHTFKEITMIAGPKGTMRGVKVNDAIKIMDGFELKPVLGENGKAIELGFRKLEWEYHKWEQYRTDHTMNDIGKEMAKIESSSLRDPLPENLRLEAEKEGLNFRSDVVDPGVVEASSPKDFWERSKFSEEWRKGKESVRQKLRVDVLRELTGNAAMFLIHRAGPRFQWERRMRNKFGAGDSKEFGELLDHAWEMGKKKSFAEARWNETMSEFGETSVYVDSKLRTTQGEANMLFKATLEPSEMVTTWAGNVLKFDFTTMPRYLEFIDSVLGTKWKTVSDVYHILEDASTRDFIKVSESIEGMMKNLPRESNERLWNYSVWNQKGGKEILKFMKKEPVEKLTPEEMKVYDFVRGELDRMYREINVMRKTLGKKPLPYIENYFTFMRAVQHMEEKGLSVLLDNAKEIINETNALQWSMFHKMETTLPFLEKRAYNRVQLNTDFAKVFKKYMHISTRHVHMTPLIHKMRTLLDTRFAHRWVDAQGKEHSTFRLGDKNAPGSARDMRRMLSQWTDFIAGKKQPGSWFNLPPYIEKPLQALTRNHAFAILGFSFRTAFIQPSAIVGSMSMIGSRFTVEGLSRAMSKKWIDFAMRHSKVLLTRNPETSVNTAMSGLEWTSLGKMKERVGEASLHWLQVIDMFTARSAWLGSYRKAKVMDGLSHVEAVRYADSIVIRTQGSALRGDVSPIQRTVGGKALTAYQTFVINQWGMILRDIIGVKNPEVTRKDAISRATNFFVGINIINMVYEDLLGLSSPFPTPIRAFKNHLDRGDDTSWAIMKALIQEGTEPIPVIGGTAKYGTTPLGPVADILNEIAKRLGGRKGPKRYFAQVFGEVAGFPGSRQLSKQWRQMVDKGVVRPTDFEKMFDKLFESPENFWNIIVGTYPEHRRGLVGEMLFGDNPRIRRKKRTSRR